MKNNKYILLAIFIFIMNIASAQEVLSLQECRRKAVEHNNELMKASFQKQEAVSKQKAAKTAYFPSLSANASMQYMPDMDNVSMPGAFLPTAASVEDAQNGNFTGDSDVWLPGFELGLNNLAIIMGDITLSQPVYAGGKIKYTNKQAEAGVDISNYAFDLKYSEIIEQTDQAYWNVVSVQAQIEVAEKYIEMLTELEEQMTDMYDVGISPASEKLKVSVQKNEAELNLIKAKNGLRLAKMYLNHFIGEELTKDYTVVNNLNADINMISFGQGLESALQNRNELKILNEQLKISEYDKKITLADYLPELGVAFSYSTYYINKLTDDVTFNPTLAGQLSIPIFNWGQSKHKQKAASLRIKQTESDIKNTNELINLEVQRVQSQIQEAYESVIVAKKGLTEAKVSLDEVQASFDVGLNTTTDLLNAQASWCNANAELISSLAQYEVLQTSWLKATGNLNP